jgi:endonuclease YncB( thermonuclease family)
MARIFTYHVSSLVSVHDGDTCTVVVDLGFDLSRRVDIRVNGIDTPEMMGASKAAAVVARDVATAWIKSRVDHLVLLSKELDKYGRVLGDLQDTADGSMLSDYMINQKLAHAYGGGTKLAWSEAEYIAICASTAKK